MTDQLRVECPGCGKTYPISQEQLGKKATCQACGEKFVLRTERTAIAPPVPAVEASVANDPPPEVDEPKGFFGKLKAAGKKFAETTQKAIEDGQKQSFKELRDEHTGANLKATDEAVPPRHLWMRFRFLGCSLQTDFGLDPKTDVSGYFSQSCLIVVKHLPGLTLKTEEVLRIPLTDIETLEVETADRMTMGRIGAGYLLGGPFGAIIGGMWKKQDKFLRIDWDGSDSVVFGTAFGPGAGRVKADALKQKITEAIRQVKETGTVAAIESAAPDVEMPNDGSDIADAIQTLAALHDQGILTDDEFAAKKAELLSRM